MIISRYLRQKDFTIAALRLFARRHKYLRSIQVARFLFHKIMMGTKNGMDWLISGWIRFLANHIFKFGHNISRSAE
jgi:hypothetical protein